MNLYNLMAYVEGAQSDPGKSLIDQCVVTVEYSLNHPHSVQVVIQAEEHVQQEQLTNGVQQVQQLDQQVGHLYSVV